MRNLRTVSLMVLAVFLFGVRANGQESKVRAAGRISGPVASVVAATTEMQALTVPANPFATDAPHRIVSGRATTLKGIARNGADQFMWEFGDGSMPTVWMPISNPYNLGMLHTYNGAAGQNFVATLSVRSSSNPSAVKTALYPLQIADGSNLAVASEVDVRRDIAIDEALWFLHLNQIRDTFAAGAPGYSQTFGTWQESHAGVCGAVDAFETMGHAPDGEFDANPYVEDVRRGLNYILANARASSIGSQPAGNPDTNGNGFGIYFSPNEETGENGVCAKALADSKARAFQSTVGVDGVFGRSFQAISQDAADWFAFGLNDGAQGGWGPFANSDPSSLSETTYSMEVILALMSAQRNMGVTLPNFVRSKTNEFFEFTRRSILNTDHGGWGLRNATDSTSVSRTAAGLTALTFLGVPATDARFTAGLGYLYRHWTDSTGCVKVNLGNAYAMHAVKQAMTTVAPNIGRITEFNFTTGTQTSSAFDWYHTLAGQTQAGIANNIISRQRTQGSWMDATGCTATPDRIVVGETAVTAFNTIALAASVAAVASQPPQAGICNCGSLTQTANADVTLSGMCSVEPDANRTIVKYEWDFNYNAAAGFFVQATGQVATKIGGYPTAGTYKVALRVTDDNPPSQGGEKTSIASCSIVITQPVAPKAPTVTITQSPNGSNGWFNTSPATAHVVATDNGSGVKGLTCKVDGATVALVNGDVVISTQGDHLVECSATDTSGNATGSANAHVKLDSVKPVINGSRTPAPNASGWNAAAVTVSFTCTDISGSGLATNSVAGRTVSTDGSNQAVTNTGSCVDNAGNSANAATVSGINIDSTGPIVTFNNNRTPYSVAQKVNIVCSASDALSGVATSTCTTTLGDAYTFGIGSHTLTATATDNAGNSSSASTTFVVTASANGICDLLTQFMKSSPKYQQMPQHEHDFTASACEKLTDLATTPNGNAKKGKLNAFENNIKAEVNAGWLTQDQADIIITLARSL